VSTPVGPYSPAVRAGQWLVCSGQIGIEQGPDGPVLAAGGFEEQTRRALANVGAVLWGRELGWAHVVKTTVFLTDMAHYGAFNDIYVEVLGSHRPARSVVAVNALPMGALVEIEAWAYGGDVALP
jgi:2-iminobutanoate/2-iminopropanoate deaminase